MMSLETKVITIRGNFARAARFVEGTWQSSAEITKDRITQEPLRDLSFYPNNHALYDIEEEDAFLYFGSKDNSIFRKGTIGGAFYQLVSDETNNYYRPPAEDVAKAKQKSLRLRISELELKFDRESDRYGYFEVDTSDLTGSKFKTDAQRQFAEAVKGSMNRDAAGNSDYGWAMQMLNNEGIKRMRIYLFRKETVLEEARDGPVAKACWLSDFTVSSNFFAFEWDVKYNFALRGFIDDSTNQGIPQKSYIYLSSKDS